MTVKENLKMQHKACLGLKGLIYGILIRLGRLTIQGVT